MRPSEPLSQTTITAAVDEVLRDMPPRDLVERTVAAERARIIAWLREQAEQHRLSGCVSAPEWRDALLWAATDIEQGREVRKATHE